MSEYDDVPVEYVGREWPDDEPTDDGARFTLEDDNGHDSSD